MTRTELKQKLYQNFGAGAISLFSKKHKLRYQSVSDWFGGRNSFKAVENAIRKELKLKINEVIT